MVELSGVEELLLKCACVVCLALQEAWSWTQAKSLAGTGKTWPCGEVLQYSRTQPEQRPSVVSSVRVQLHQVMGRERKAEGMAEGCRGHRAATLHRLGGQGTGIVGSAEGTTLRAAAGETLWADLAWLCCALAHIAACVNYWAAEQVLPVWSREAL